VIFSGVGIPFATCLRSHGEPNVPDPSSQGQLSITGIDPNSPQFQSAENIGTGVFLTFVLILALMILVDATARRRGTHTREWPPLVCASVLSLELGLRSSVGLVERRGGSSRPVMGRAGSTCTSALFSGCSRATDRFWILAHFEAAPSAHSWKLGAASDLGPGFCPFT
jgi:hypothetical protein